ncbi:NAD(P)H-flavin reductase [Legionella geestiana]|uniref:NAD(P)H-flavin reductase n=1 Tax=Legionella geestiana TaxID=45065 RepID=UPI0010932756|nr:NAD(P)H-flavin reductase [Legionella geestiana]QDQ40017.1 NAD(P)H-flavin reductase [Legionella geestiana]
MSEQTVLARVESISPLTDSILRLVLVPADFVPYYAGQYLQILFGEEPLLYSIANAPLGSRKYELHLRHSPNNPGNCALLAHIRERGEVVLRLPFGDCHLERLDAHRPLLLIAGGTGFAPVHAMLEELLARADTRPFELYWGARSESDLYFSEKVTNWQRHATHFKYASCLADASRHALIKALLTRHAHDLSEWQAVIAGPFDMVFALRDALVQAGMSRAHLHSDAFAFEERQ